MNLVASDLQLLVDRLVKTAKDLGLTPFGTRSMVFEFSRKPGKKDYSLYLCTEQIGSTFQECVARAKDDSDNGRPFGGHNMDYPEELEGKTFSGDSITSKELKKVFLDFANEAGIPNVKPIGWHGKKKETFHLWMGYELGPVKPTFEFYLNHWSKTIARTLENRAARKKSSRAIRNVVIYYELEGGVPIGLFVNSPSLDVKEDSIEEIITQDYQATYLDGERLVMPIGEELILQDFLMDDYEWFLAMLSARIEAGIDFRKKESLSDHPIVFWAGHEMEWETDLSLRKKAKKQLAKSLRTTKKL